METAAKLSGATLGFIWNNVEGAYYGYHAGKELYKWRHGGRSMPPPTPPRTPRKRKAVDQMPPITRSQRRRIGPQLAPGAGRVYYNRGPRTTPRAVTQQHDIQQQYRKRKRPKKQRRRWKKFVKKVQAVNLRDQGLVTVLFNSSYTSSTASSSQQTFLELHLYGLRSSASGVCGVNDLATLVTSDYNLSSFTGPLAGGIGGNVIVQGYQPEPVGGYSKNKPIEKIKFESAIMDATIYNSSVNVMEVDIYTIVYSKNLKGSFGSLAETFQAALDNHQIPTQINPGDGVINNNEMVSITARGCTPFELGAAISIGNIKILKKEKVLLQPGQAFTQQHRDPKNRTFDPKMFYSMSSQNFKIPGMTISKLFIGKNVDPSAETGPQLKSGCTRIYKYSYAGLKDNMYAKFDI